MHGNKPKIKKNKSSSLPKQGARSKWLHAKKRKKKKKEQLKTKKKRKKKQKKKKETKEETKKLKTASQARPIHAICTGLSKHQPVQKDSWLDTACTVLLGPRISTACTLGLAFAFEAHTFHFSVLSSLSPALSLTLSRSLSRVTD